MEEGNSVRDQLKDDIAGYFVEHSALLGPGVEDDFRELAADLADVVFNTLGVDLAMQGLSYDIFCKEVVCGHSK